MTISQLTYHQVFSFKSKSVKYKVYTIKWFNNSEYPEAIFYQKIGENKIFTWLHTDKDFQIELHNSKK